MINEEKVRVMTKLAAYEKNEGKKYLPISKYYRSDFIGLALIKNFFLITIGYVLLVGIVAAYFAEELMDSMHKMNLIGVGAGIVIVYVVILLVYSLLVYIIQSVRYSNAKKSVKNYYTQLGEVAEIYIREEKKMPSRNKSRRKK